jgi:hypothetical protein
MRVPLGPLSARQDALAAWVAGRFVVFGGWSSSPCPPNASCVEPEEPALRDGASFDPATGSWRPIADAPVPVAGPGVVVADGRVYVLTPDQNRADSPASFLSYDIGRDIWRKLPRPPVDGALVAADGMVLIIGSTDDQRGAVDAMFDPRKGSWREIPADPLGPSYDREAVWIGDRLLLAAKEFVPNPGSEGPSLVRLAVLDRTLVTWSALPDSEIIGWSPVAVAGRVVWPSPGSADGGGSWGRSYAEGAIFDPSTGSWQPLPVPPRGWTPGLSCCALAVAGRVLVGGHLLDPLTREWTRVPMLPGGPRRAATVAAGPDTPHGLGGVLEKEGRTILATGYLLRP